MQPEQLAFDFVTETPEESEVAPNPCAGVEAAAERAIEVVEAQRDGYKRLFEDALRRNLLAYRSDSSYTAMLLRENTQWRARERAFKQSLSAIPRWIRRIFYWWGGFVHGTRFDRRFS